MNALRKLESVASIRVLDTCNFDQIHSAGTYVENRWGTLFRMPADALPQEKNPRHRRVVRETWPVTRLTDDPYVPVAKARRLARDLGLWTRF